MKRIEQMETEKTPLSDHILEDVTGGGLASINNETPAQKADWEARARQDGRNVQVGFIKGPVAPGSWQSAACVKCQTVGSIFSVSKKEAMYVSWERNITYIDCFCYNHGCGANWNALEYLSSL